MKKLIILSALVVPMAIQAIDYEIVTGSRTGTYYQIGRDLAKYVAPEAGINLRVLSSHGSLDNVYKLRSANFPKVKLAIVQNDVLQELRREASRGNIKARDLVNKLRVIAPLYNEEIHIISNKNSGIRKFSDLKNKTISVGPKGSGTAMTSYILYEELFRQKLLNAKFQSFDEGLASLGRGTVDAVIKVAGQPVKRLSEGMGPEASNYIQLVQYDKNNNTHYPVTSYYTTNILARNYSWLNNDIQTLSTRAYLITFNYRKRDRIYLRRFVASYIRHLNLLRMQASMNPNTPHPKWKEVSNPCGQILPGGWRFYDVVDSICNNLTRNNNYNTNSNINCTPYDFAVGLCK